MTWLGLGMIVLVSAAISCGEQVVIDGIRDIQALRVNDHTCLNVHQSWKVSPIPEKFRGLSATWRNESVRNVLWTDKGNLQLVEHYYSRWTSHYRQFLELPAHSGGAVMASDWARLLYIHRFGGLYVDLDYEAHVSPVAWPVVVENSRWPRHKRLAAPLFFVKSPFLITEVMQNSMIYAPLAGHPFLLRVCESIVNTLEFIAHPYCPDDRVARKTDHVAANCPLTGAFTNRWTKSVTWLMKTEQITGPPVLDKTYTQLTLAGNSDVDLVRALPTSDYFGTVGTHTIGVGRLATHWHANTWVTLNPVRLMPALSIVLTVALGLIFTAVYAFGKHERFIRSGCIKPRPQPAKP